MNQKRFTIAVVVIIIVAALAGVVGCFAFIQRQEVMIKTQGLQTAAKNDTTQQLYKTVKNLFLDYNSCLPRFIAPRELKENNTHNDELIDIIVCAHDAIKKFAVDADRVAGNDDFISSLRFGTCDGCSEAH